MKGRALKQRLHTARRADFSWFTHRKMKECEKRPPGKTLCPPTCQKEAVWIRSPAEEPSSRRVKTQQSAVSSSRKARTRNYFFFSSDGRGRASSPYHRRPAQTGGKFYTGLWKSNTGTGDEPVEVWVKLYYTKAGIAFNHRSSGRLEVTGSWMKPGVEVAEYTHFNTITEQWVTFGYIL